MAVHLMLTFSILSTSEMSCSLEIMLFGVSQRKMKANSSQHTRQTLDRVLRQIANKLKPPFIAIYM